MAMEFWGIEVKAGEPLKVQHEEGTVLHLSQASLGEAKKGNDSVLLSVNIDGKKIVLGTLSHDRCPQISYDLVFEKEFELSHNWKHGSVHFCGYRAETQEETDSEMFESGSEFEEEETPVAPVAPAENGKPETKADKLKASVDKAKTAKQNSSASKAKVKDAKPVIDEDGDSSDSDDDSEEDDSDDEDLPSESEDDDEESSEEEADFTPKNAKQSKKRPAESATKTPAPEKKAKLVTPQKSGGDGKKGSTHTATPHPSKQAGKTNANADKSKQQTPKSAGQVVCKSCSKTFNSDGALQSHTKAKHSDAK